MTDYTLMIAATTGVCSYVAGIITMGLFTGGKSAEWREQFDKVAALADEAIDERNAQEAKRFKLAEDLRAAVIFIRQQGRELAEYRASRQRSTAPLKVANEARKAKRLEREAAARELTNARHAAMRKIVGELV